ncbi:MAG: cupin domain-containing protein [Elusimicrobiaceae bacterium]|nr:cupin domain-containing protein [Elusimicrobiaceae bacterium]
MLLVTNGEGRHQIRGQKVEILHPGDVVSVPPNVEHWHGAAPDSWFSHVALTPNAPDNQPIWLEKVTDEEYK